jgi:hypothetical protein
VTHRRIWLQDVGPRGKPQQRWHIGVRDPVPSRIFVVDEHVETTWASVCYSCQENGNDTYKVVGKTVQMIATMAMKQVFRYVILQYYLTRQ